MIALLALSGFAAAAGYSTDIELARPTFSGFVLPGFDAPQQVDPGTLRVGTALAYQRDPLLLYREDVEIGAVVHQRVTTHVGLSADVARRLTLRAVLPLAGQWGSETERLAADGVGTGDMAVGARANVLSLGPLDVGTRLDLMLPTGIQDAYLGEGGLRAHGGVLLGAHAGPLSLVADVGVLGRGARPTGENFVLGNELVTSAALAVDAWPGRTRVNLGVTRRAPLAPTYDTGVETPAEVLIGTTTTAGRGLLVDAGAGRGLTRGYGASQFRTWVGLTWVRSPDRTPPAPALARPKTPPPPEIEEADLAPPPPPPPAWKPQELARVDEAQILIRDPIQFARGTNEILPVSSPTLDAISKLLSEHPEIAHLVIEGHASDEGTFAYNYDLSVARALQVYRALVVAGVHPARMSCRGMGEVAPVLAGSTDEALAANRRVVFHISRQLRGDEAFPAELLEPARMPWDGDPAPVRPLPARAVPEGAPAPGESTDPRIFRDE
ncbi:MAG: hypothetical protein RLZZ299_1539 [Pseudomonadota bacterium]